MEKPLSIIFNPHLGLVWLVKILISVGNPADFLPWPPWPTAASTVRVWMGASPSERLRSTVRRQFFVTLIGNRWGLEGIQKGVIILWETGIVLGVIGLF